MQGILFKQWYKPVNVPSTSALNRKHLNYIATRFGAVHNQGCSFGLFGKLPNMSEMDSLCSLESAKEVITEVSKRRTIYRAVLSLDHQTALEKKFYNRAAWEDLIQKHIQTIAKEMRIDEQSMCWTASYHHERGHPHVHIMYWDNSRRVRQEFIPKERFEVMTDKIKAAFNRELFGDDIRAAQTDQKAKRDSIQMELKALFKDFNLADTLNLHQVKPVQITEIGNQLRQVFLDLPRTGRLAYKYLAPEYKAQLDECIGSILKISSFSKLETELIKLRDDIGTMYGNSASRKEKMRADERARLNTDMGNAILKHMNAYRKELSQDIFGSGSENLNDFQTMVKNLLNQSPEIWERYAALLGHMPNGKITPSPISADEIKDQIKEIAKEIRDDIRIRTAIKAYAEKQALPEGADEKTFRRKVYGSCYAAIDRQLRAMLYTALADDTFLNNDDKLSTFHSLISNLLLHSPSLGQRFDNLIGKLANTDISIQSISIEQKKSAVQEIKDEIRADIHVQTAINAYIASQPTPDGMDEKAHRKNMFVECMHEINNYLNERIYSGAASEIFSGSTSDEVLQTMCKELISNSDEIRTKYESIVQKLSAVGLLELNARESELQIDLRALSDAVKNDAHLQSVIYTYLASQPMPPGADKQEYRKQSYTSCMRAINSTIRSNVYYAVAKEILHGGDTYESMATLRHAAAELIHHNDELQVKYHALLAQMPKQRTPFGAIMIHEQFASQFNDLCIKVGQNVRIRTIANAYALAQYVPPDQDEKLLRKEYYTECSREISKFLVEQLKTDARYPEQAQEDLAIDLLLQLFQMTSQHVNHQQSQRLYDRFKHEKSKAAQRDFYVERAQDSGWEFD